MALSQYCLSPSTRAPYLRKGSPTGNCVSLWIYGKSTIWLRLTILTTIIQLALCQMQHNTWQGSHCSAKQYCSQAYHCLQMTDQRSVEMLAFNFASRTFVYKRLAQGVSRSVSAFSSFMRECLDPVVKSDQCGQYVDDIGIAAKNATDLTRIIRAVFKCIRQAGLKLTIEKCHFGVRQVEFLGRTISPEGISPQARRIQIFLISLHSPNQKRHHNAIWVSWTTTEIFSRNAWKT